jgi:hypothetical protein
MAGQRDAAAASAVTLAARQCAEKCAIAAGVSVVTVRLVLEPLHFQSTTSLCAPASGFHQHWPEAFFCARLSKPAPPERP